jgi:hypothetical protein
MPPRFHSDRQTSLRSFNERNFFGRKAVKFGDEAVYLRVGEFGLLLEKGMGGGIAYISSSPRTSTRISVTRFNLSSLVRNA